MPACPEHSAVLVRVSRNELELTIVTDTLHKLAEDVDLRLTATRERLDKMERNGAVREAGLNRGDKMLLAVMMALGPLAAAAIALLK